MEYIQKNLRHSKAIGGGKKERGEVFTPVDLIESMFSAAEKVCPDLFSNPQRRFLDPCAGIGNFSIIAYHKLMNGLHCINNADRKKHILTKMLFMIELDPDNANECKKFFGPANAANIYTSDFLGLSLENFDIIFGNPPYQKQVGLKKTVPLWPAFVEKSLGCLNSGGLLIFVHPPGWRNVDGLYKKTQKLLLQNDIKFLSIHSENDGLNTFSAATRYDWYVLKKTSHNGNGAQTIVTFQDGLKLNLNIKELQFLPNANFTEINGLLSDSESRANILYDSSTFDSRKLSKTKSDVFKWPVVYTVNSLDEPSIMWSSNSMPNHRTAKLIWSNGSKPGSLVDREGLYALSQFSYAIIDSPEVLDCIKKVFDSPRFRYLMEMCTFGQGHINYKVLRLFSKKWYLNF